MRLSVPLVLTLVFGLALAGCDSAEDRAEKHFQSGMDLLEAGDVDRALVEFRNVFDLNGRHREARLTYARIQRERGAVAEAYSQYLRSAEQYPEEIESRLALAEMAIEAGNWEEAERHGRVAAGLAPDAPAVRAVVAALDYQAAILAEDPQAAAAAAEAAAAVLAGDPDRTIARRLRIDHLARAGDTAGALAETDIALAAAPADRELNRLKLRLLAETGDDDGLGAHLQAMYAQLPEDEETRRLLIAWYMQRGDLDGAERLLRDIAAAAPEDPAPKMTVVQFLREARGAAAAEAELDRLVAAGGPDAVLFRATRAALAFDAGRRDAAIAELEAALAGAEPSEAVRNAAVALARMQQATGNRVGARARIEAVLAEAPDHVGALKMRAAWLIEEDRPGDAILALRTALAAAPRDPEILTLMGRAHERDGARALAGERYALAVEVSGRGAAESLLYAEFLVATDRAEVAEAVLVDALAVAPADPELLTALAEVRMRRGDWDRAAATVARLRDLGTPRARATADDLATRLLLRQDKIDETIAFLEGLAGPGGSDVATVAAIVQAQVRAGRTAEARATLDDRLAETPDDPALRFLRAGVHVIDGEADRAEALYRGLLAEAPGAERVVRALRALLRSQGREAEAAEVLDAGLAASPGSRVLRLERAAALERGGDFEGAIAVYEALYAEDGEDLVIANNLASLLSAHREDAESLERAAAVARRLRGIEVPAFQDTWGWIESRRGNPEAALPPLEAAARGLPEDPLVRYHLGMTYLALGRAAAARTELETMLDLAGPDSALPQVARARAALAGLE